MRALARAVAAFSRLALAKGRPVREGPLAGLYRALLVRSAIGVLIAGPLGFRERRVVQRHYSWSSQLSSACAGAATAAARPPICCSSRSTRHCSLTAAKKDQKYGALFRAIVLNSASDKASCRNACHD